MNPPYGMLQCVWDDSPMNCFIVSVEFHYFSEVNPMDNDGILEDISRRIWIGKKDNNDFLTIINIASGDLG